MRRLGTIALSAALACATPASAQAPRGVDRISHIVVLFLENRSFDNLFGEFPGADGVAEALNGDRYRQRDAAGAFYDRLPPPHDGEAVFDVSDNPRPIREIPWPNLPNAPFAIDKVFPMTTTATHTRDLVHKFYTNRAQINGGRNDRFAAFSDAGGLAMGYYSRDAMERFELWRLARENVLLDRFFMGTFGGSFLAHMYLVCACAPSWPDPPGAHRSLIDAEGLPRPGKKPGQYEDNRAVSEGDGHYAVNTIQSVFLNNGNQPVLLPAQMQPTIGDRLSDKGVEWAWYSGAFALAIKPDRTEQETRRLQGAERFQWHHQPFAYFARFNPADPKGLQQRTHHLRDATRLEADILSGALPPVTFYKPYGPINQHPGYANLDAGDAEVGRIAELLKRGPMRDSFVLVVTYDENGGQWDHVAPPMRPAAGARADFLGPGTRIPAIVVSPFAAKGVVDHTEYDTSSILKFIVERFQLEPLPSARSQAVNSLSKTLRLD